MTLVVTSEWTLATTHTTRATDNWNQRTVCGDVVLNNSKYLISTIRYTFELLKNMPPGLSSFYMGHMNRRNANSVKQRHAAPSAPWPWIDIDDHVELYSEAKEPWACPHPPGSCVDCWKLYPQSLFPNWTKEQVDRSGMKTRITSTGNCIMHRIDVKDNGDFVDSGDRVVRQNEEFWQVMQQNVRSHVGFFFLSDYSLRRIFLPAPREGYPITSFICGKPH